jgi:hypothetical protein
MPKYRGELSKTSWASFDFEAKDDEAAYDWWMDNWPELLANDQLDIDVGYWDCDTRSTFELRGDRDG